MHKKPLLMDDQAIPSYQTNDNGTDIGSVENMEIPPDPKRKEGVFNRHVRKRMHMDMNPTTRLG